MTEINYADPRLLQNVMIERDKHKADATYWRKRTDEYSLQLAYAVNHADKLAEALRDLVNVAQRIGPPAITQGGLCEEQDWQTAMRNAVTAITESEGQ